MRYRRPYAVLSALAVASTASSSGGFAQDPSMGDFGTIARKNMLKLAPMIQGVNFRCEPYWEYKGKTGVLYCDPPYAGTTDFSSGGFNHEDFWEWVRSRQQTVVVSEYTAPKDFKAIWKKPVTTTMKDKTGKGCARVEKLFQFGFNDVVEVD